MNINLISSSLANFQGNLKLDLADIKPDVADIKPAVTRGPEINEIEIRTDNLMADNFFDPNKGKSTYQTVMLESFQTREMAKAKRGAIVAILAAGIEEIKAVASDAGRKKIAAEKYYSRVNQVEIAESHEDHLESERDKLKEAAQGNPESGGAQSAPVSDVATSDSGSASIPEDEAAPVPEASAASVDVFV